MQKPKIIKRDRGLVVSLVEIAAERQRISYEQAHEQIRTLQWVGVMDDGKGESPDYDHDTHEKSGGHRR